MKNKNAKIIAGIVFWLVLVASLFVSYFGFLKPRLELKEIAQDTCDQLDGAIMLQVGSILSSATNKTERLGFSAPELGDKMRELCPDTMDALERWAEEE